MLTAGCNHANPLLCAVLEWDENTTVSLQLWDVAGHERFGTMTRVYYKYAIAAIIGTPERPPAPPVADALCP